MFGERCGPCPDELGGLCVELQGPELLGTALADAAGTAVLTVALPETLPPGELSTQAAAERGPGGTDSVKSNPSTAPISRDSSLP